jgi:hypothetical protein
MLSERDTIWKIANIIHTSTVVNKVEHFAERYKNFVEKYPVLYLSLCKPGFDMAKLKYMLGIIDEVNNQDRTIDDATKMIGQQLFDEYVDPIVKQQQEMKART